MSPQSEFPLVFEGLKNILKPFEPNLTVTADTPRGYSLDGPYSEKWQKQLFFGATRIQKNYVSFYLMPVYMFPDLLKDISPELKKRMQGKSCFNFRKVEPDLFKELADLTNKSVEQFRKSKENGEI